MKKSILSLVIIASLGFSQEGNIIEESQMMEQSVVDNELQNAVDTIKLLGKATRDAEVTENPNVIQKTPEEMEEERQLKELNSFTKSLKAIKAYLEDTKKNLVLSKTLNNVGVAKINKEKFFIEKQTFDLAIQEIETNIKEFSKINAQISLIERTLESNNYAVTQSVFNSFSTLISQISTSVDLSGMNMNANMGFNNMAIGNQEQVKEYYEFFNNDRVGNNIFIKKINSNSIELYFKG